MFDIGRDHLHDLCAQPHRVLGGLISPTHDQYTKHKPALISSGHRNAMCRVAADQSDFVRHSSWETQQEAWPTTRKALDAYKSQMVNYVAGATDRPGWISAETSIDDLKNATLYLLCGDDLLISFNTPGLWKRDDIEVLSRDYGLVVLSRGEGSKSQELVNKSDILKRNKENVHFALSDMGTDISSTKIRLAIKTRRSVRYLVDEKVIEYIRENRLYAEEQGERPLCTLGQGEGKN